MKIYKVVLIDDEPIIIEGLKILVDWEYHGYEIAGTASDGMSGVALIEKTKPDLVICDITMPNINGLELIERCRHIVSCKFIVLSGYAEFSYAQKCVSMGVFDYLLKPIEANKLDEILEKVKQTFKDEATEKQKRVFENNVEKHLLSNDKPLVSQIEEYVTKHCYETLSLDTISSIFHVSPTYLSYIFKKQTEQNYLDYVTNTKIRAAKKLLRETSLTIYEIAEKLNYKDVKYFSNLFAKKTGNKPSEYRRMRK